MSSMFKDAYEGSWTQQFIAGISKFFDLNIHEQAYLLLRLAFDHPFLAIPIIIIIFFAFIIIIAVIQDEIEKYNSIESREARLVEKIKIHNETKLMIDSRSVFENEIKSLCGGLFFGLILFFIISVISGRGFSYFLTWQQGWLIYFLSSILAYIGVRQYKTKKYNKSLTSHSQEKIEV